MNEFTEHLRTQLGFLEKSAASYDAGDADEALRMAVSLRVMFHDTPHSTSLMHHLDIRRSASLLDTAGPMDPHNLASIHPLTLIRVDPKARRADHVPVRWLAGLLIHRRCELKMYQTFAAGLFVGAPFDALYQDDVDRGECRDLQGISSTEASSRLG